MSFLAPLYIAGAIAVALPVVLHLIRRVPRDRVSFSSLMFLSESPPRVTRKSRLENVLLLILRGGALCLLALAFARPFLRQPLRAAGPDAEHRLFAILVDTSASMRRANLWPQVAGRVERVLADTRVTDEVALYTFDRQSREVVGFEQWRATPVAARRGVLLDALQQITPGWASTQLGSALASVADAMDDHASRASGGGRSPEQRIVLVSDLQRGADCRGLDRYDWPDHIRLQVETVLPAKSTNAGVGLAAARPDAGAKAAGLRLRISNAEDSEHGQVRVRWAGSDLDHVEVYVPPGRARVVQLPEPPQGNPASQVVIEGDDHEFDNHLYVAPPPSQPEEIWFVGSEAAEEPGTSRFFLERALADQPGRTIRVRARRPDEPLLSSELERVHVVVVTEPVADRTVETLRQFMDAGGTVFAVLTSVAAADSIGGLVGPGAWRVEEASLRDYVMMGEVDRRHPLFAPFADPRVGDFTKIHFWKYRRLDPAPHAGARVLAWFDNRDPALVELSVGAGTLLVLATGWRPDESQLALSSKFVPLLLGIIDRASGREEELWRHEVGDTVTLPDSAQPPYRIVRPDGSEIDPGADAQARFSDTSEPGVYTLVSMPTPFRFAVNVAPEESRTAPRAVEELEQMGVRLTAPKQVRTMETAAALERQMQAIELEARQKLWRWTLLATLAVLLGETWFAGWLARRRFVGEG